MRFELIDYRQLDGRFDRIVSIGMFEHVGAAHYEEFYAKCRELLTDDGVMLLHTIGKLGGAGQPDPFTDKWIFPGYHLPSDLADGGGEREGEADLERYRESATSLCVHAARMAQSVHDRRMTEIVKLYDERFFRMWEFYLAGGIVMFESGAACNYQVQYIRDRRAVPITRDYMAEAEGRYREVGGKAVASAKKPRAARKKSLETTGA